MNILPKLPVCPYCNAIYRYGEVKNLSKYKNIKCRHCKKIFRVSSKKRKAVYLTVVSIILILINLLFYNIFRNMTIYISLSITVLLLCVAFLLLPYTVKFVKSDINKKIEKENKKAKRIKK